MRDKPRLLDQVRDRIRAKHYSLRTEQACIQWIKRFIFFHGKRHPKDMAAPEVEAFLSHLATEKNLSASTQSQALEYLWAEFGEGYLPYALERKYPNAGREWGWQYVFPSSQRSIDPIPVKSGGITSMRRSCSEPSRWPFGMRESPSRRVVMPCAIRSPPICFSPATNSFGPSLALTPKGAFGVQNVNPAVLSDRTGTSGSEGREHDVIYTQALNRGGRGVRSPLDSL